MTRSNLSEAEVDVLRNDLGNAYREIASLKEALYMSGRTPADPNDPYPEPHHIKWGLPMAEVDTSDEACAVVCMLVSNPQGALRKDSDGWQKRVNDLIRALRDERNTMRAALETAEKADQKAVNCEEHESEMAPETCEHCFPFADDARLKRWAALGINQPPEEL